MSEFKTIIQYPILNTNLEAGVLDDLEVIGGYKVVQTHDDLDVLKVLETVELEETDTQDWKPRKHILKNGTLVYVAAEDKTYRWKTKSSYTDENGIEHATDGEWILEEASGGSSGGDVYAIVDENGVLTTADTVSLDGVNRPTLDYEIDALRDELLREIDNIDTSGGVSSSQFNALENRVDTLETKVDNIGVSGGGGSGDNVDLSGYATTDDLNDLRDYIDAEIDSIEISGGGGFSVVDEKGVLTTTNTVSLDGVNRNTLDYELNSLYDMLHGEINSLHDRINNISTSGGSSGGGITQSDLDDALYDLRQGFNVEISALISTHGLMNSRISELETELALERGDIDDLDDRVSSLENGSSGSVPTLNDDGVLCF